MKERLLFVAAGPAQAPAIREARALGYYVVAMDGDASAPGLMEADEHIVADILDAKTIVKAAKETGTQGILSVCCDVAMEAVAQACEELHLPGIPANVVSVSRSKFLQRHALKKAGLLVPSFERVTTKTAALAAWDRFQSSACVIKPEDSSGSRGVSFVDARNHVANAFELALENSKSGHVLVESFMPGIEYSVEAWAIGSEVHVLASSEKARTPPPYLLDRQVHFPDLLSAADRRILVQHAIRAIKACGFRDCPVHLECIWGPEGPMVVELAARGAGSKVFTEILPSVTGISTTRASIEAALGQKPELTLQHTGMAASLMFLDPVPGVFQSAGGVEAALALPYVSEVIIYPQVGQRLRELRSGPDRAGHLLVYAPDADTCRSTAQTALSLIQLQVTP